MIHLICEHDNTKSNYFPRFCASASRRLSALTIIFLADESFSAGISFPISATPHALTALRPSIRDALMTLLTTARMRSHSAMKNRARLRACLPDAPPCRFIDTFHADLRSYDVLRCLGYFSHDFAILIEIRLACARWLRCSAMLLLILDSDKLDALQPPRGDGLRDIFVQEIRAFAPATMPPL